MPETITYDIPGQVCPHCGYSFTKSTSMTGSSPPRPGAISICSECGGIGVFDTATTLRKMSAREEAVAWLINNKEMRYARNITRNIRASVRG